MKIASILITALATGALGAQEAPHLDGRIQLFAELSRPAQIVVAQTPSLKDQPARQTGVGVRFMGEVASAPGWYYELGGMFDASSNLTLNGDGTASPNFTDVKVTDSYWSLGAGYMGSLGKNFTWGAHLEGRGEYLRIQGEAVINGLTLPQDQATTYLRPWLRGSLDYTFATIGSNKHPYIGVEASYAILKTSQTRTPDFNNLDNRTLKALAPRASAAFYAGLRF